MKLCTECNKKFDSDSNFCDECGSQLIDFEIKYCPKCGAQCTSLDAFCQNCSNPLSEQPSVQKQITPQVQPYAQPNVQPQKQTETFKKSNNVLLAAIIGVLAVILTVIIIIFVKLTPFSGSKSDSTDKFISSGQPVNPAISENIEDSEDKTDNILDLTSFQDYYDSINDVFNKLIISSSQKGELKSYKTSLKDAIQSNNLDKCQYNYDKLLDLEKSLEDSSKSEIKKLTDKIKKYEKKEKCKKAKKRNRV